MVFPFSEGVERAITEHKALLGANEHPGGSNRTVMGEAFGMNGEPYCAIALWYTTNLKGGSSGAGVKSASSSAIRTYYANIGMSVSKKNLQRGDYVHVYKNGKSVHIERVLSVKGDELICIGSNTSNTSGGSTADGGGTYINDRTSWYRNWGSNDGWAIKGASRPFYGVTTEDVKLIQSRNGLKEDGLIGTATLAAIKSEQSKAGVKVDGFPGPATMAAIKNPTLPTVSGPAGGMSKPVPAPAKPVTPAPKVSIPTFPLPSGYYYGPASGPVQSVSGKTQNTKVPKDVTKDGNGKYRSIGLYQWQKKMKERGWKIAVDGKYGDETKKVASQFQKNKGLVPDGLVGKKTWDATFSLPVT